MHRASAVSRKRLRPFIVETSPLGPSGIGAVVPALLVSLNAERAGCLPCFGAGNEGAAMRGPARPLVALGLAAALVAVWGSSGGAASPGGPAFMAGAASADVTPPAWTSASDAAFVPECG